MPGPVVSIHRAAILNNSAVGIEVETECFCVKRKRSSTFKSQPVHHVELSEACSCRFSCRPVRCSQQLNYPLSGPSLKVMCAQQVDNHLAPNSARSLNRIGPLPRGGVEGHLLNFGANCPKSEGKESAAGRHHHEHRPEAEPEPAAFRGGHGSDARSFRDLSRAQQIATRPQVIGTAMMPRTTACVSFDGYTAA